MACLLIPGAVDLPVGTLADELLQGEPVLRVCHAVQLHVLGQPPVRHVAAHGAVLRQGHHCNKYMELLRFGRVWIIEPMFCLFILMARDS